MARPLPVIAAMIALVWVTSAITSQNTVSGATFFSRGDSNGDSEQDVSDAIVILLHLFGGRAIDCQDAADANDDGQLNIADPVFVLNYLFANGAPPRAPFPDCGVDPSGDSLGCATFPPCGPDLFPPCVTDVEPAEGVLVTNRRPAILATLVDESGIDLGSIAALIDGVAIAPQVTPTDFTTAAVEVSLAEDLGDGTHTVTFVADDLLGNSGSTTSQFIVCVNVAPALLPIGDQTVVLGGSLSFDVNANDSEGDRVVFDVAPLPLPRGASFDGVSGEFQYRPESDQLGVFSLTFSARGNFCGANSETIQITVDPSLTGRTSLEGVVLTTGSMPLADVRLVVGAEETLSAADGRFFTTSRLGLRDFSSTAALCLQRSVPSPPFQKR